MAEQTKNPGTNPLASGEKNDNPNLKKAADDVRKTQKKVNERVEEINKGNPNPEVDASKDDLDLFNAVTNSIIGVYEDPQTAKIFESMANKLGVDITEELVKLISTTTSYAIFGAIGNYGDWLNKALQRDFNTIDELISRIDSNLATNIMKLLRIERTLITKGILEPIIPTEDPKEKADAPKDPSASKEEPSNDEPENVIHNGKYKSYPTSAGWNVADSSGKIVGHFPTEEEADEWINEQNGE